VLTEAGPVNEEIHRTAEWKHRRAWMCVARTTPAPPFFYSLFAPTFAIVVHKVLEFVSDFSEDEFRAGSREHLAPQDRIKNAREFVRETGYEEGNRQSRVDHAAGSVQLSAGYGWVSR
jgi:hypothetical protein